MAYIGRTTDGFGVRQRFLFTPDAGATSVSGTDANGATLTFSDSVYMDVFLNGVLLKAGTDYNTNTANTIAGLTATVANDEVTVLVYDIFTTADMVSATSGGTFSGNVTHSGTVTVDDTTDSTSTTTGSIQTDGGLGVAKDVVVGDDVLLKSDAAVVKFGADSDVTLTHVADTGLLLNSTMALQFNDASQSINAPSATVLDINATDEIELNATAVDLNGTLDVSGTSTFNNNLTVSENNPELFLAATADGGEGSLAFKDDDGNIDGKIAYRTDYSGQTDNYMTFFTNGSNERMRIDDSGNVGIGTDSPSDHLHVKGFVQVEGKSGDGNYIRFDNSANSGNIWRIGPGVYSHTTFSIYNQTDNSQVVNIESVNDQLMFRSMTVVNLADDATAIAVANSFQGLVVVTSTSNALTAIYKVEGQNIPTLISGNSAFTNSDTDGKFCLISAANSNNVTFRNRYGATYGFKIASFGVLS